MRKAMRMLAYVLLAVAGLFLVAAGGWYWVTHSVEQPPYEVLIADGAFELRQYQDMVVAEAATSGDRREGVRQGFRALAGYIFARNREGDTIAMTAPVIQEAVASSRWRVRFVMPAEYGLADLPAPGSSAVSLTAWQPTQRAAFRFSGVATDRSLAEAEAGLRTWMSDRGLVPSGQVLYAYYDDPWTPGFLRRNEVLVAVE